ncbi:MAG: tRNA lysidine(34) synthetase TilS [Nitrospiraceae bacterium]|nr:tRNA lysidine(34) synthetase TilS [Nitrospiraceae bacterium]
MAKHALLERGATTLVAVSGGVDSVCLLDVLLTLDDRVEVAHFDHQTRDGESAEDASFVRALAARLGVPLHEDTRPVAAEAREAGRSFEEHARNVRYDFLVRTAEAHDCAAIATGHHADDQAETVLMRILRGTTPRGLAGIVPLTTRAGRRIVRPLLECTRAEIMDYVQARGLSYRTDRTNDDQTHFRNRVRHDLLPSLTRDYNPRVREALLRLAETQRGENELLNTMAASALNGCVDGDARVERERFAGTHAAIQRRIMAILAWRLGVDCDFERIDAAARFIVDGPTGHRFDLGGGVLLYNARHTTEIVKTPDIFDAAIIPLAVPGATEAFGRIIEVTYPEEIPVGDLAAYCTPGRQVFDADALGGTVAVRHRRPGDRFTPFGMSGSKKLQDYFVDTGLPAPQRDAQLIVEAGDRIAWVVGHAISAHAAVTADTRRYLQIEVYDASS